MCVCARVSVHVFVCASVCVCVCKVQGRRNHSIKSNKRGNISVCIEHTNSHTHSDIHMHTHTHTHTRAHTHTHTHTRARTHLPVLFTKFIPEGRFILSCPKEEMCTAAPPFASALFPTNSISPATVTTALITCTAAYKPHSYTNTMLYQPIDNFTCLVRSTGHCC